MYHVRISQFFIFLLTIEESCDTLVLFKGKLAMYEYPTIPFFHPDDPKFGNTLPPMTDQEWEELQQSHRESLTGIEKFLLTLPTECDKVCACKGEKK